VMVNAWMNTPTGLLMSGGTIMRIDPIEGMLNPSTFQQDLHMLIASYAATGLAVAGVHAALLKRRPDAMFHRRALILALAVGVPAAIVQPFSGDVSARAVALWQPVKLAALEGQFGTEQGAPLRIGGWPDVDAAQTRWAIEIPDGLSLLAFHDPNAEVRGLMAFARDEWPPVAPVHVAFQIMVGLGTLMAVVSVWAAIVLLRKRDIARHQKLLAALTVMAPFGFIATEAGWTVTEVGRQPWAVQGIVRTAQAVTPMPGLVVPMITFALLYVGLGAIVVIVIRSIIRDTA